MPTGPKGEKRPRRRDRQPRVGLTAGRRELKKSPAIDRAKLTRLIHPTDAHC